MKSQQKTLEKKVLIFFTESFPKTTKIKYKVPKPYANELAQIEQPYRRELVWSPSKGDIAITFEKSYYFFAVSRERERHELKS